MPCRRLVLPSGRLWSNWQAVPKLAQPHQCGQHFCLPSNTHTALHTRCLRGMNAVPDHERRLRQLWVHPHAYCAYSTSTVHRTQPCPCSTSLCAGATCRALKLTPLPHCCPVLQPCCEYPFIPTATETCLPTHTYLRALHIVNSSVKSLQCTTGRSIESQSSAAGPAQSRMRARTMHTTPMAHANPVTPWSHTHNPPRPSPRTMSHTSTHEASTTCAVPIRCSPRRMPQLQGRTEGARPHSA